MPAHFGSPDVFAAIESDHSLSSILLVITLFSFPLSLCSLHAMRIAVSLLQNSLVTTLFGIQLATRLFNIVSAHARSHAYEIARCLLNSQLVHSKWIQRTSQPTSISNNNSDTIPLTSHAFIAKQSNQRDEHDHNRTHPASFYKIRF